MSADTESLLDMTSTCDQEVKDVPISSQRITMMEAHCPSAGHDNTPNQRVGNLLTFIAS
jgi:hypothetical protein